MYKTLKYVLDCMFTFMMFVSIGLFFIALNQVLQPELTRTVEIIDFTILGGYYAFFFHGLNKTKNKIKYVKNHWMLVMLLALPFLPLARLARFAMADKVFKISSDTIWHILAKLEML